MEWIALWLSSIATPSGLRSDNPDTVNSSDCSCPLCCWHIFLLRRLNHDVERQQHWLHHIDAAEAFDGSVADKARSEGLTPKGVYL